ncbi:MAG: heme-binding domain-containing protein [Schleiferiaceae bacterium]|jgi:hypothetical protein|nr:heme-binding domain-containing protein [Schleiferiaceae bacterium]
MSGFGKKIILLILIVLVVLQLLPVDRANPEIVKGEDFIELNKTDEKVASIMRSACYDCHSHETVWPWYSYVAPVSWVVADHVEHGREELNFSTWKGYSSDKMDHKLEECIEALEEGWMPEEGYVSMHEEANLSEEQKELLIAYFSGLRAHL